MEFSGYVGRISSTVCSLIRGCPVALASLLLADSYFQSFFPRLIIPAPLWCLNVSSVVAPHGFSPAIRIHFASIPEHFLNSAFYWLKAAPVRTSIW